MLCMQAATRILWTNRLGAGTRMIDGLKIRGGLGLGHRRGRELFEATVKRVQVGPKSLAQDTTETALDALWAVYGSVRGCIRGHSDLSCCRAAHGMAAIGCQGAGRPKTRAA